MVLSDQLVEFFNNIFHDLLCSFRKGRDCQTILLRLIEDWKSALDKNCYVAAILMDLSKAFNYLPHNILLSKLARYGLSSPSVKLSNKLSFRGWSVIGKFFRKVFQSLHTFTFVYKRYFLLYWTWFIVQLCWWQHLMICWSRLWYFN